ncbi:hypothetical protein [Bradyrhizobium uaiense]|uniref:Uncharacterized protein n=1 Tax=Bradyrhizobium uaiense TaxID=2594946 RepID=A0A6P1BAY4_9BRAD|nr:hypothetical protein [Bradyrhizobium uaiense]NEU94810.1 hypothetical protein [Bradyrhizobium uaiense]
MSFFPKQPASRQGVVQNVAFGAASAQLPNKFGSETYQVRLAATGACYYVITESASPTAATAANGAYLPGGVIEYVIVSPGETLTVIQASAGGTLSVCEVS